MFDACELFYNLFEEVYGQNNCSYSVHVVGSHILKVRGHLPLTERSAFMFESYFSEMKNLFQPGTPSSLKQILKNSIMKRSVEYHTCQKSIFYGPEKNNAENNHLIYTFSENEYQFYKIINIDGDIFTCNIQGKFPFKSDLNPTFNWNNVGVFKLGPISNALKCINVHEVRGKVILVDNLLVTCPINVLIEK